MLNSSPHAARVATALRTSSLYIGKSISWLTLLMMLLMTTVVVLRYVFHLGWIALQESVIYLHAFVLMLGMASTLANNEHVRVDIFYRKFSVSKKRWVDGIGHLLFLIPICIFILIMSWSYVMQSWQIMEGSQEAGGLPLLYLLKTLLLLMPFLLILQAIADLIGFVIGDANCEEQPSKAEVK